MPQLLMTILFPIALRDMTFSLKSVHSLIHMSRHSFARSYLTMVCVIYVLKVAAKEYHYRINTINSEPSHPQLYYNTHVFVMCA